MSNYPPGVTDARYAEGVYKYSCADHGTSYGHGYMELGGLFLEDDAVALCSHAEDGEWVRVSAAQCEPHGEWTEHDVISRMREYSVQVVWDCPRDHWFITEEV